MGCIKTKEMIRVDSISQRNNEINISNNNHYIKQTAQPNEHINFNDEDEDINNSNNEKINISNQVNNEFKKVETESLKMKKYLTKADRGTIEDNYKIISKLGKGSFGSVFKVQNIKTNEIRALKVIKKTSIIYQDDDHKFLKEIEILIKLEHPNIIKIYEYYTDDINFYLITDYISNGELYNYVYKAKSFNERQTQYIMKQVLCAVNYLHLNNIAHRDIKLENILVEQEITSNDEQLLNVKLIDFGTSNYVKTENTNYFTVKVGSPFYMAPEVLNKKYNNKCDIWSCGVIMFMLLRGHPPFKGENQEELFKSIQNDIINYNEMTELSELAKELMSKMLERNVDLRYSADECLKHKWMKIYNEKSEVMKTEVVTSALNNISNYHATEKLQQATMAYIVHFISFNKEVEDLKTVFNEFDKNKDGLLSFEEIDHAFTRYCTNKGLQNFTQKNKLIQMLDEIDTEKTGHISYEQFLRISIDQREILNENNLRSAFEKFDTNKDGKLSKEEIKNVLGIKDFAYVNELLKLVDENKDGFISFEEFKSLMDCVLTKQKVEVTVKKEESEDDESESSFMVNSQEKQNNKFDKEKFLELIES